MTCSLRTQMSDMQCELGRRAAQQNNNQSDLCSTAHPAGICTLSAIVVCLLKAIGSVLLVCGCRSVVDHEMIDEINILQAAMLAMQQAVEGLSCQPDHLLIDGNRYASYLPCNIALIAWFTACTGVRINNLTRHSW